MADVHPGENIGEVPMGIRWGCHILFLFDLALLRLRNVIVALAFGEAWKAGSWVNEVGEDLVYDFDRQCLEAAVWG